METFESRLSLPVPPEEAYAWHARPGAFRRLAPPWQRLRIVGRAPELVEGSRLTFRVYQGPFYLTWVAEHRQVRPGRSFRDVQIRGPFAHWDHLHEILPAPGGCELRDRVLYRLPLGAVGRALAGRRMRADLERLFRFRHRTTAGDFADHLRWAGERRREVVILGGTGPLGESLAAYLSTGGHGVRHRPLSAAEADPSDLEGVEVLFLLSEGGAPEEPEWLASLPARLGELTRPPLALLCVTRLGAAEAGSFEASAACAADAGGVRLVLARVGRVLSRPASARRVEGPWISIDDALGALQHLMLREDLAGPIDLVAPAAEAATPSRLLASGYRFRHPERVDALRHLSGEP